MDDSSELPRSLFVVECYKSDPPQLNILQLQSPNLDSHKLHKIRFNPPNAKEEDLFPPPPLQWSLSPPTSSTGEDLYMFPDWSAAVKTLHCNKFNLRTGNAQNICPPPSIKEGQSKPDCSVNHGGRIYLMFLEESVFGCYDPENNSWKALKPFPYDKRIMPFVKATAALDDTILFYMSGYGFKVYDVGANEWYSVDVNNSQCYSIVGEAVVIENTICAITALGTDVLLALTIEKEVSGGGDVVFKCSVRSEIFMPSMTLIVSRFLNRPFLYPHVRTKHMVHLGGVDFCLVRSRDPLSTKGPKLIHVTYMRLREGKVIVKSDCLFKTRYDNQSEVVLCFSLPKWNTSALEEGKQFLFELDPFTAEDHCSIRVSDLPPTVEEGFDKNGPIKRDRIKVKNKKGGSLDFPEYPRFASKPHAIKVPQSLFAVVFCYNDPHLSILQLDTLGGHRVPEQVKNTNVDGLKEHVVCFNEAMGKWSLTPISSTGDLYLFPDWCVFKSMHGFKFNFSTGSFEDMCLPSSINGGEGKPDCAVNLGGRIYRMDLAESVFGCYDPENNSWKALKPFPYDKRCMPIVRATAALDDTILFYMSGYGFQIYDVRANEWYLVDVDDYRCYSIEGEAVVLKNTIYATTPLCTEVVLAISIKKEVSGGDVVFKCSLRSEILMPRIMPMRTIVPRDENRPILFPRVRTRHLVHLGGVDFCLVRSCAPMLSEDPKRIFVTYIHVTYMSLTRGKVIVNSVHLFKTRYEKHSEVVLCFSLPNTTTTALKEGKQFVFELEPILAGLMSRRSMAYLKGLMEKNKKEIMSGLRRELYL